MCDESLAGSLKEKPKSKNKTKNKNIFSFIFLFSISWSFYNTGWVTIVISSVSTAVSEVSLKMSDRSRNFSRGSISEAQQEKRMLNQGENRGASSGASREFLEKGSKHLQQVVNKGQQIIVGVDVAASDLAVLLQ